MPSYGLIIEGDYDVPVFTCLTIRLDAPNPRLFPLQCGGIGGLRKKLVGFLRLLERIDAGQPVDKALVISDCDNRCQADVEAELRLLLGQNQFSFPNGIELCGVRRETETWLLADENAINIVAVARGGRTIGYIPGTLEDIQDAKQKLRQVLAAAHLPYTPPVLEQIAQAANLDTWRYRLPSFSSFASKV